MRQDAVPGQDIPRKRNNFLPILTTGIVIGLIVGAPLGWFTHRIYYQYHSAQVLLCRQKHLGQPEVELQALCGSAY